MANAGNINLTRYLPRVGVERLANGDIDPLEPWQCRAGGALLFADIAGFVTLTEKLTRDGPKGSEKVTEIIEEFLNKVTDTVLAAAGMSYRLPGIRSRRPGP